MPLNRIPYLIMIVINVFKVTCNLVTHLSCSQYLALHNITIISLLLQLTTLNHTNITLPLKETLMQFQNRLINLILPHNKTNIHLRCTLTHHLHLYPMSAKGSKYRRQYITASFDIGNKG